MENIITAPDTGKFHSSTKAQETPISLKPTTAEGKLGAGVVREEEGSAPSHDAVDESLKDDTSCFDARATLKSFLQFFN